MSASVDLDELLVHLGPTWAYEIAHSGGSQRVAILFENTSATRESCLEITVPPTTVEGKDLFARDPLVCRFTLLNKTGQRKQDLLVVGVHLASGQHLVNNHNQAMSLLVTLLKQLLAAGTFPSETEVLIAGDFNASRYDNKHENFWTNFDGTGLQFETLSPAEPAEYPGTRLAGVPLSPKSQIDYVMASSALRQMLVQSHARVHDDLPVATFNEFRQHLSDHLPVTVRIRLQ